jgi:hypothetical protein
MTKQHVPIKGVCVLEILNCSLHKRIMHDAAQVSEHQWEGGVSVSAAAH